MHPHPLALKRPQLLTTPAAAPARVVISFQATCSPCMLIALCLRELGLWVRGTKSKQGEKLCGWEGEGIAPSSPPQLNMPNPHTKEASRGSTCPVATDHGSCICISINHAPLPDSGLHMTPHPFCPTLANPTSIPPMSMPHMNSHQLNPPRLPQKPVCISNIDREPMHSWFRSQLPVVCSAVSMCTEWYNTA